MGARARQAFKLQNMYRGQHGVRYLKWHKGCRITAKAAALVIVRKGKLEHDKWWFKGLRKIFRTGEVGENIGWGYDDPDDILRGWVRSKAHERNILDRDYTHGAIASVYSKKLKKRVWVSHFAEKR